MYSRKYAVVGWLFLGETREGGGILSNLLRRYIFPSYLSDTGNNFFFFKKKAELHCTAFIIAITILIIIIKQKYFHFIINISKIINV